MGTHSELNALITRNIADLELARQHLNGPFESFFLAEVGKAFEEAIGKRQLHVVVKPEDADFWFADRGWLTSKEVAHEADLWVELNTYSGVDQDSSWLAAYLGKAPERVGVGLFLEQRLLNKLPYRQLVRDKPELAARLRRKGFRYDAVEGFSVPIVLDQELLASELAQDAVDRALEPIREAVRIALGAMEELDELCALIRGASGKV